MHAFKLSKLNKEDNETASISNFLHLFIQHTKNDKFKNRKETSIEVQSKGEGKATWPIDENESKKDALSEARVSATPNQLHLKKLYGECYPHNLAPNPEMKVVTYAGKTFGRCQ